jgi:hypothetical protein
MTGIRSYRLLLMLTAAVCLLSPWRFAHAADFPSFAPCYAKTLPGGGGALVIGHVFHKEDKCVPVFVTLTWDDHYDTKDGYTRYTLHYVNRFAGEFWYATDRKEFAIVADPAHWAGPNEVLAIGGYGQYCARFDELGQCEDLRKFDLGQVHAVKTLGFYLGSLTYGYPTVTTNGEKIPITFFASTPLFEFENMQYTWMPEDGLVKINNAALASFDYAELVLDASAKRIYTAKVGYNLDNDTEDMPTYHQGGVSIRLDFNPVCKGDNQSDMAPCEQIKRLMSELKFALEMRDLFREVYKASLPNGINVDRLRSGVIDNLRLNHPDITDSQLQWAIKNAGGTDPATGESTVPDYCDECAATPLCQWKGEAIAVHEETHRLYMEANPGDKQIMKLWKEETGNQYDIEAGRIYSQMEYRAYNRRAAFLRDLIQQQLNETSGCSFEPQFYVDLSDLSDKIDIKVTFEAPPGGDYQQNQQP